MDHELKTWPQYFQAVKEGRKTFEWRKNNRGFQSGDTVNLREYDPKKREYAKELGTYSGDELQFRIGYVLQLPDSEYCVFSLLDLDKNGNE